MHCALSIVIQDEKNIKDGISKDTKLYMTLLTNTSWQVLQFGQKWYYHVDFKSETNEKKMRIFRWRYL